jgi:hypothetical protein
MKYSAQRGHMIMVPWYSESGCFIFVQSPTLSFSFSVLQYVYLIFHLSPGANCVAEHGSWTIIIKNYYSHFSTSDVIIIR